MTGQACSYSQVPDIPVRPVTGSLSEFGELELGVEFGTVTPDADFTGKFCAESLRRAAFLIHRSRPNLKLAQ